MLQQRRHRLLDPLLCEVANHVVVDIREGDVKLHGAQQEVLDLSVRRAAGNRLELGRFHHQLRAGTARNHDHFVPLTIRAGNATHPADHLDNVVDRQRLVPTLDHAKLIPVHTVTHVLDDDAGESRHRHRAVHGARRGHHEHRQTGRLSGLDLGDLLLHLMSASNTHRRSTQLSQQISHARHLAPRGAEDQRRLTVSEQLLGLGQHLGDLAASGDLDLHRVHVLDQAVDLSRLARAVTVDFRQRPRSNRRRDDHHRHPLRGAGADHQLRLRIVLQNPLRLVHDQNRAVLPQL